jgi:hypothetical protein
VCSFKSYTQKTYYNPSNKVDITITIKESYKPVDYSKIGRDFNTMIQNELQRRENLKRYYDEIYYQTKNSLYSSTILTTDNLVNSKILMVQSIIIEELDIYNRLLKNGIMKPSEYESNVRNIYFTYMNTNQIFLQIVQYKYNKDLESGDQTKINEHCKLYTNTLNSFKEFKINNSNEIEFVLNGLIYPNRTSNSLFEFVRSSSEGGFDTYKINWENEDILNKQNILTTNIFNESWKKMVMEIIKSRSVKIESLNEKEKLKYLKSEKKYLYEKLGKYYIDSNFGKGNGIDGNIEVLIYRSLKENQKVGENNYGNKFYKNVDEFCGCGKYNSNIFK